MNNIIFIRKIYFIAFLLVIECGMIGCAHNRGYILALEERRAMYPSNANVAQQLGRAYYDIYDYKNALDTLQNATKLNPDSYMIWNNLGWVYLETEEYYKMYDAFGKAVQLGPYNYWNNVGLGIACVYLKRFDEAIDNFSMAIKKGGYIGKMYLGLAYVLKGDVDDGEKFISEYIGNSNEKSLAYNKIARFLNRNNDNVNGLKYGLEAVAGKYTDYPLIWNALGWIYDDLYDHKMMKSMFQFAYDYEPSRVWNAIALGLSNLYLGKIDYAQKYFSIATSRAESHLSVDVLQYSGMVHLLKGDEAEALDDFSQYENQSPRQSLALRRIGNILYKFQFRDFANEYYLKSVKVDPLDWVSWNRIGWVAFFNMDYKLMEEAFSKALENENHSSWTHIGLSWARILAGDVEGAINILNKIIEDRFCPQYYYAYQVLGYLALLENDVVKAEDYFEKFMAISPCKADGYFEIGDYCYFAAKYDIAEKYINKSLEIDKDNQYALSCLGWIYLNEGKYSDSEKAFNAAIKLGYFNREKNYIGLCLNAFNEGNVGKFGNFIANLDSWLQDKSLRRKVSYLKVLYAKIKNEKCYAGYIWNKMPYLGIDAMQNNESGIFLRKILPNTIAYNCGLREHDVLLEINGITCNDIYTFREIERNLRYNNVIQFKIIRDGKTFIISGNIN